MKQTAAEKKAFVSVVVQWAASDRAAWHTPERPVHMAGAGAKQ